MELETLEVLLIFVRVVGELEARITLSLLPPNFGHSVARGEQETKQSQTGTPRSNPNPQRPHPTQLGCYTALMTTDQPKKELLTQKAELKGTCFP